MAEVTNQIKTMESGVAMGNVISDIVKGSTDISLTLDPISAVARSIEEIFKAAVQAWIVYRQTMNQTNRDRADNVALDMLEWLHKNAKLPTG